MAWRGRGRGRGRGGGYAAPRKFELFPELEENVLPKASSVKSDGNVNEFMIWSHRLQTFWKLSPYYLEEKGLNKDEITDVEKFSDRRKKRKLQKDKLSDFIKCTVDYVPGELAQGFKPKPRMLKKLKWKQDEGLEKLDFLEKLELKLGGKVKEDEEEEEEEEIEESDGELSDGEYAQFEACDDDEDDFNPPSDNDDEGQY